ncbi:MAG: YeeE/YedE family protein [Myxococcales bacterium]|nr:YeeE/YedE family protein [Myxococcales bacterium]
MKGVASAFAAGFVFAIGLAVGGMTQPSKVVDFLDFFGDWDPSLAFVMGGAVVVHALLYRVVTRRKSPLFDETFHIPRRRDFTPQLVFGSAMFGIGWGLGGFCPGPGIAALPSLGSEAIAFVVSMTAGMLVYEGYTRLRAARTRAVTTPTPGPGPTP